MKCHLCKREIESPMIPINTTICWSYIGATLPDLIIVLCSTCCMELRCGELEVKSLSRKEGIQNEKGN